LTLALVEPAHLTLKINGLDEPVFRGGPGLRWSAGAVSDHPEGLWGL